LIRKVTINKMTVIIRKILMINFMLVFMMGCSPLSESVYAITDTLDTPESERLSVPSDTAGIPQRIPTACCDQDLPLETEEPARTQYLFGVLNDDGLHYEDEWQHGVRATNLELHWDRYEPSEGDFDWQYINHLRQIMVFLKTQGWYVQLVPGYHYIPEWVFAQHPDFYLINQYGEVYHPDPLLENDKKAMNTPFNPQARALVANYLEHLLTVSFPQDDPDYRFDSIRIGGGLQGELRYPPKDWNGHTNSYWAFDASAQNPDISRIPENVVGWRPGIDPNPGTPGHGQLIVNPGFEDTHAYYPVYGWSPDDEVAATFDPQSPHSGNNALKISIESPHRVHQFVRVEPDSGYVVSAWLRSYDGIGQARLFLTQYDSNSDLIQASPFVKLESAATSWEYAEATLQTSASTRFLKVEVDGDRAGSYAFDDLQLKQVGETDQRSREISIPTAFYDWYIEKLTDFQNWQINEIRKYSDGQLDILYAGKGIQSKQIMGALTNDMAGDGWSEGLSALYAGTDFLRHVMGLTAQDGIALFVTGIDVESPDQVDDSSSSAGEWSAAHWIAHLGSSYGFPVWGENSGQDPVDKMWLSAQRMHENNFIGMMWGFEAELYADPNPNEYATIADYERVISFYNNLQLSFLPIIILR
jgi:hypothetical protein